MSFLTKVKEYLGNKMDSRAYDQQKMAEIRQDIQREQQIAFETEYRQRALEVAKARAIQDAQEKSGYKKLQALNRAANLSQPSQGTALSRLAEYTQKNRARTEANLQKTQMLRQAAKEEMVKRQSQRITDRQSKQAFRGLNRGIT